MIKKYAIFLFFTSIFFIGCSNKQVNVTIPQKGEIKTLKCKNINFNSNNKMMKLFFNSKKNKILLSSDGINCNIENKVLFNLKTKTFNKVYRILYSSNQKQCSYFVQKCIDKEGLILCSKFYKNEKLYLQIVEHYKFKNKNFYYYNNNLYKIKKTCLPSYINIECKKITIKLANVFSVNGNVLYSRYHQSELAPCNFYNTNYIYQYEINNLKQELASLKNKTKETVNLYLNTDLNSFIKKFFPHKENISINVSNLNFDNNSILKKILDKIENNKKITKQDLKEITLILKKLQKQKNIYNNINYYKISIIKYILLLKLNLINQENYEYLLKQIKNLKNNLKNSNIKEEQKENLEKTINQILSIYKKIYLEK